MASRDVRLELDPQKTLAPQSVGGALTGASVDLSGAEAALIIVNNGAATTAATVKVQESADNSTFTDVADTDLIGLTGNSSGVLQTASTVVKVSYIGAQRYIRVNTLTGASAALLSVEVVRAHLRHAGGVPV
jgi:hypothetical protein